MKIEDHWILLSNPILATCTNSENTKQGSFYTNLLKDWISELEKQLEDRNAAIDFLSAQIIAKSHDIQKNKRSD